MTLTFSGYQMNLQTVSKVLPIDFLCCYWVYPEGLNEVIVICVKASGGEFSYLLAINVCCMLLNKQTCFKSEEFSAN